MLLIVCCLSRRRCIMLDMQMRVLMVFCGNNRPVGRAWVSVVRPLSSDLGRLSVLVTIVVTFITSTSTTALDLFLSKYVLIVPLPINSGVDMGVLGTRCCSGRRHAFPAQHWVSDRGRPWWPRNNQRTWKDRSRRLLCQSCPQYRMIRPLFVVGNMDGTCWRRWPWCRSGTPGMGRLFLWVRRIILILTVSARYSRGPCLSRSRGSI